MSKNTIADSPRYSTQLLSQKDVEVEYGIVKTQFYELTNAGEIPYVVCGKRGRRVQRCDIDAWIATKKL
jgi:excisionase family DNA binding protein